ncbi:guanylate kinase [Actinobacillus equuli subsp. haemolyticus]|uniref:Guanylate kinase n=1 Tax=Actinobacillus equuli subsp. equuli TaxID=202947 RepID=A0A9X4G6H7_ACTEU|nr:guanylate kinase [Actinobacillus equuli]MDE8035626.1 guanylate kinase [Actinobacillus equuli subsp. equuli]MDG4949068.1 guanylate kinase [Actinobacillus equuli subsp. haemolyticus]WGE51056.1 guanylate kinase [Actinobacillus equuli subsp. haemolyticus]WGE63480.1 guanylate kinase [Actinobacillus equuli subsp. haemolyticus]WGE69605.1 guanylate kinase [Actinobacillus equuli subsp. haemolyticus]
MSLGNLYILSAPSGAGKSSLINALLADLPRTEVQLSISHTTRNPRPGEEDGVHYYFTNHAEFEALIEKGHFLEWAEVFGNYYGTSLPMIEKSLAQGIDVFLDIDWQGARQIRQKLPNVKTIFILPPSRAELEKRLFGRGQDSAETIAKRMAEAISEMSHYNEFDYVIVNDDFQTALGELKSILTAERLKLETQTLRHKQLIEQLLSE